MPADVHALVGAYALDAVDDADRRAFARHVRRCDACTTELGEYMETLARLAESVGVAAPPRLRGWVLGTVAETPQDRSWRERFVDWFLGRR